MVGPASPLLRRTPLVQSVGLQDERRLLVLLLQTQVTKVFLQPRPSHGALLLAVTWANTRGQRSHTQTLKGRVFFPHTVSSVASAVLTVTYELFILRSGHMTEQQPKWVFHLIVNSKHVPVTKWSL